MYVTIFAATAGEVSSFRIQSYDEIGNQVAISPKLLFFLLKPSVALRKDPSNCQVAFGEQLSSSLQKTSNTSAVIAYVYNLTGSVALQGILLQRGGLSLYVFDDAIVDEFLMIRGSANLLHSTVDMNFGSPRIDIDFAKFYSSTTIMLLWRGYIVPSYTESYTFYLSTNGCVNVNVSGTVLFSCSAISTNTLKLRENQLHYIEISYLRSSGEPFVVLFWQSHSQEREIIPPKSW